MSNQAIYQMVTDAILARLDKGEIPWRKPWQAGFAGAPRNFLTGKPYRGVNVWLLSGWETPFFLTMKAGNGIKARVRKGEKSTLVVYWNVSRHVDKATKEEKTIFILRYYRVFNVTQFDGIAPERIDALKRKCGLITDGERSPFETIEACESIVSGFSDCPPVHHGGTRACYSPALDSVSMPEKETFDTPAHYYATLFHELAHATGHASRLGREGIVKFDRFGSEQYSKEELCAEFASSFLCGVAGIEQPLLENSAAYIASWSRKLKEDCKLIIQGAGQAQKASDYILGIKEGEGEATEANAELAQA